ncbi:hypothetical protein [Catenulispora yoronensis]
MMAGITVLPDLPPGWPRASSPGALVEDVGGHVVISWNAPVTLTDSTSKPASSGQAEDQIQQRREAINKAMLSAIAEVLTAYTVEIDTVNWTFAKVIDGPGTGWTG